MKKKGARYIDADMPIDMQWKCITDLKTYPDVDFGTGVFLPEEDFRSGVRRRSAPRVQLMFRRPEVAETKVGNLDVTIGVQQQVFSLYRRQGKTPKSYES